MDLRFSPQEQACGEQARGCISSITWRVRPARVPENMEIGTLTRRSYRIGQRSSLHQERAFKDGLAT